MRSSFACVLVLAVVAVTHASAATSLAPASPESFFFRVSPITATPEPADGATRYTVAVTNAPVGNTPFIRWYLDLQPGTTDSLCSNEMLLGGTEVRQGRYGWKNQGLSFVWYHGAQGSYASRPSYGCNQGRFGEHGYPGTVTVVFENDSETCTASFVGIVLTGTSHTGPAASCQLGGYLPLPVPRPLLRAYAEIGARLSTLLRQAQSGTIQGGDLANAIDAVLKSETDAFRLFPPVWGCRFEDLFQAVVDARVALGEQLVEAVGGSMRKLQATVRGCQPTAARPIGVPDGVVRAVAGLAARAEAVDTARAGGGAVNVRARLRAVDVALQNLVTGRFPPVFGMAYAELVDRVLAESSAAALATRAASTGHLTAVGPALVQLQRHEGTIASGLRKQAAKSAKAEKAA